MSLSWIREDSPVWDEHKAKLIGDAPQGVFDRRYQELELGAVIPCEWWRVEDDGETVGYGWLDVVWGDAEILLVAAADKRARGVGTFILDNIEREAATRGLRYLYNTVRPTHPDRAKVSAWLEKRGFRPSEDGSLLRTLTASGK